ncbi:DNA-3-methyladenine glycosylase [Ruficoccus amylovorans]|uniref:Putative 3-methyladenine DNA glycosylase n=1 Tax=Ruficoccus amylovorans TaxID=1804625 RepID=A0A842HG06_9BACT|nr:DNA-3-methyladenine glycosylase [Ruficoccus amylovorans]MBC2595209.1 DNA-3-methyladenine glycosylase [Ruficoccus amylovorans]
MSIPKGKVLPVAFYRREAETVTRELLGKALCRALPGGGVRRCLLTELEAYVGPHDKACHASKGKTPRTAVMFEPGGVFYVYLCYGMHWMLNIVTGAKDYPAAVLVRGVEEISGPGRVTKQLGIGREQNALPVRRTSGLWVEDVGIEILDTQVERTPRIGINYAGEYWVNQPLRYLVRPK